MFDIEYTPNSPSDHGKRDTIIHIATKVSQTDDRSRLFVLWSIRRGKVMAVTLLRLPSVATSTSMAFVGCSNLVGRSAKSCIQGRLVVSNSEEAGL